MKYLMSLIIIIGFNVNEVVLANTSFIDKRVEMSPEEINKFEKIIINKSGVLVINSKDREIEILPEMTVDGELQVSGFLDDSLEGGAGGNVGDKVGGKQFQGFGGSGASNLVDGNNGIIGQNNPVSTYDYRTRSKIEGGAGGKSGLSSNSLKFVKPLEGLGVVNLSGKDGTQGEKCIIKMNEIKIKCNPFDCCLDNSGKGACIERGVCYEECSTQDKMLIASGGGGAGGNAGNLIAPKINKKLTILLKSGKGGDTGECEDFNLRGKKGKDGLDGIIKSN